MRKVINRRDFIKAMGVTGASGALSGGTERQCGGDFSVGGSPAPYPGHWGLPAWQRINCRCTRIR